MQRRRKALRELASLVIENGFTDFEFENENIRVRLSKMTPQMMAAPQPVMAVPSNAPAAAPAAAPADDGGDDDDSFSGDAT